MATWAAASSLPAKVMVPLRLGGFTVALAMTFTSPATCPWSPGISRVAMALGHHSAAPLRERAFRRR